MYQPLNISNCNIDAGGFPDLVALAKAAEANANAIKAIAELSQSRNSVGIYITQQHETDENDFTV